MAVEDQVIAILTDENNRRMFKDVTKSCSRPKDFDPTCLLELQDIEELIQKAKKVIMDQPMLLELLPPVNICGDIHGQFLDLLWVFECGQYPPQANYLFLGDFVDRGRYSIEVVSLLMAYKVKYPTRFFLLRGNHESNPVNESYSFKVECTTRFKPDGLDLWNKFGDFFNCLPAAAVIGGKIFCVHGGLSPNLKTLDHIRRLNRPIETPVTGLLCDLVWADPDKSPSGWKYNEARAISYRFGTDVIRQFLEKTKLNLIVRAHELMKKGYEIMPNKQLITIFSAPNYTGVFNNNGAFLVVNEDLNCTIISLNTQEGKSHDELRDKIKYSSVIVMNLENVSPSSGISSIQFYKNLLPTPIRCT